MLFTTFNNFYIMVELTLISKKEIAAGQTYAFDGHTIECHDWTERGKNGNNDAAQFIGLVDGKEFKGSVTQLKKAVGAKILTKEKQGSPESIFNAYICNIRNIKSLPSYYIEEIENALNKIAVRKQETKLAAIEAQIKALEEEREALKK